MKWGYTTNHDDNNEQCKYKSRCDYWWGYNFPISNLYSNTINLPNSPADSNDQHHFADDFHFLFLVYSDQIFCQRTFLKNASNAARLRRWRSATSLADAEKPRTLTNFKKAPARSVRNTRMLEPLCHRVKETCYRSPPFTATFKEAYELPTKFDAANANTVCSRSVGKPSCLPTKPTPKRISSAKPSHLSPIPAFKTCQLRFSR